MNKAKKTFRKVGLVLLFIGILDVIIMAYCFTYKINYSSNIYILAMIIGILLLRDNVKTASVTRWFSVFFIIACTLLLLLIPFTMPFELFLLQIRLNTVNFLSYYTYTILLIGLLIWVYFQLSSPGSVAILEQENNQVERPLSAIYSALGMIVVGGIMFALLLNSESAVQAKTLAKQQLGHTFKYHISTLSVSADKGSALVTAYNPSEIKEIQVKW